MREFISSAESAEDSPVGGEPQTVKVDGREVTFRAPDSNHLILLVAATEASAGTQHLAATLINAFFALIEDPQDASYFRSRLFDPNDAFGFPTISEIMVGMLEEWSARPTQPSPTSSLEQSGHGSTSKETPSGLAFHRGPSTSHGGSRSSIAGSVAE